MTIFQGRIALTAVAIFGLAAMLLIPMASAAQSGATDHGSAIRGQDSVVLAQARGRDGSGDEQGSTDRSGQGQGSGTYRGGQGQGGGTYRGGQGQGSGTYRGGQGQGGGTYRGGQGQGGDTYDPYWYRNYGGGSSGNLDRGGRDRNARGGFSFGFNWNDYYWDGYQYRPYSAPYGRAPLYVPGYDPYNYSYPDYRTSRDVSVVSLYDGRFSPRDLTVRPGATVVWTNRGRDIHTVTGDDRWGPNSDPLSPGNSYSWTVPRNVGPGERFYYHCTYHGDAGDGASYGPGMSGRITVRGTPLY